MRQLLWFLLAIPSPAVAAQQAQQAPLSRLPEYVENAELLATARTLQCQFDSGFATSTLPDGSRKTVPMASLFGTLTYDNIDRNGGTAREVSDVGGKDIIVLATKRVLTFVELTLFGNPVFTSVFPTVLKRESRTFLAVTSRHITPTDNTPPAPRVLGLAQYYGTCRIPMAQ